MTQGMTGFPFPVWLVLPVGQFSGALLSLSRAYWGKQGNGAELMFSGRRQAQLCLCSSHVGRNQTS